MFMDIGSPSFAKIYPITDLHCASLGIHTKMLTSRARSILCCKNPAGFSFLGSLYKSASLNLFYKVHDSIIEVSSDRPAIHIVEELRLVISYLKDTKDDRVVVCLD